MRRRWLGLRRVADRAGDTKVYVRPHDLQIARRLNGVPAIAATITRINPAGAVAKVALATAAGESIQVDVPFEKFRELGLEKGEQVYVAAKQARVFAPEYEI